MAVFPVFMFLMYILDQYVLAFMFSLNLIDMVAVLENPAALFLGFVELTLGGTLSMILTDLDTCWEFTMAETLVVPPNALLNVACAIPLTVYALVLMVPRLVVNVTGIPFGKYDSV